MYSASELVAPLEKKIAWKKKAAKYWLSSTIYDYVPEACSNLYLCQPSFQINKNQSGYGYKNSYVTENVIHFEARAKTLTNNQSCNEPDWKRMQVDSVPVPSEEAG